MVKAVGNGSWKRQLERTWNVQHEIGKNEVGKLRPKLDITTEVGKF